jgi:hypothetical protein
MSKYLKSNYISLLLQQVRQEIEFLKNHGHDIPGNAVEACIFCITQHSGQIVCKRIRELVNFESNLIREREKLDEFRTFSTNEPDLMPLLCKL